MEAVLNVWNMGPLAQAVMVGGVVILSSLLVAGISAALPFTVPVLAKAVATGIITGAVVFLLSNGSAGVGGAEEGEEQTPVEINEDVINLEASELELNYRIDTQEKTFTFILGNIELSRDNWQEDLKSRLEVYPNLKTIIVNEPDKIPYNFIVELREFDEGNKDIVIKGLEQ